MSRQKALRSLIIDTGNGPAQFAAMNGRRILAGLFFLVALSSGYVTWLTWRAEESSIWLFAVFTAFFVLLAIASLVPEFKRQPQAKPSAATRFVPHWFMMLAVLIIVVSVLAAIIGAFLRH